MIRKQQDTDTGDENAEYENPVSSYKLSGWLKTRKHSVSPPIKPVRSMALVLLVIDRK